MANKVIIGILVLLVILMGGVGYFSYTLSQQIDDLSERLTTFETQQTARVDTLTNELVTLRTETQNSLGALEGKFGEAQAEIDTVKKDLLATQSQITGLKDEINSAATQVNTLQDRLTTAVAEFSRSTIDAAEVYQKVSQVTVRINNGQNTVGSGFIFDTEGHVVTAQHVIEGLSQIYIILHDGRVFKATVVGQCQFSDVAVLKLASNPSIEPPPLADSSQVRIGAPVVTIGNPLDQRDTLTDGIVSQINRFFNIQYQTQNRSVTNLIQFDAPVNPGNSGGPLINAAGEVIGIVIARINPSEGYGIYWAVSSNKAKRVATALIAQGYFDYPWLGIGITDLTPQMVQDRALETANGILVTSVSDNSPAAAAGIKVNDIITSVDGVPLKDTGEITSYLGEFKSVGDKATISLIRDTTKLDISVEVGKRPQ